jgi:hypothetical protein
MTFIRNGKQLCTGFYLQSFDIIGNGILLEECKLGHCSFFFESTGYYDKVGQEII